MLPLPSAAAVPALYKEKWRMQWVRWLPQASTRLGMETSSLLWATLSSLLFTQTWSCAARLWFLSSGPTGPFAGVTAVTSVSFTQVLEDFQWGVFCSVSAKQAASCSNVEIPRYFIRKVKCDWCFWQLFKWLQCQQSGAGFAFQAVCLFLFERLLHPHSCSWITDLFLVLTK